MKAPPLLISYQDTDTYIRALGPLHGERNREAINQLVGSNLPPVASNVALSLLFGFSTRFLSAMASQPEKYYRTFTVKKGNGRRTIHAPKVALKVIQKWLAVHLAEAITFDDNVYGFVKGKSAFDAAKVHSNSKWIYSLDIENFFPTTPKELVKNGLLELGYPEYGAELIADLSCLNGYLAQGSPLSPFLSNLIFTELDKQFIAFASERRIRYSRYADDIILSGTEAIPNDIKSCKEFIERSCWSVSENKEKLLEFPKQLKVHGLIVSGDEPRLPKRYRNKIRGYKHSLANENVREEDIAKLKGHLSYAKSIEDRE